MFSFKSVWLTIDMMIAAFVVPVLLLIPMALPLYTAAMAALVAYFTVEFFRWNLFITNLNKQDVSLEFYDASVLARIFLTQRTPLVRLLFVVEYIVCTFALLVDGYTLAAVLTFLLPITLWGLRITAKDVVDTWIGLPDAVRLTLLGGRVRSYEMDNCITKSLKVAGMGLY